MSNPLSTTWRQPDGRRQVRGALVDPGPCESDTRAAEKPAAVRVAAHADDLAGLDPTGDFRRRGDATVHAVHRKLNPG